MREAGFYLFDLGDLYFLLRRFCEWCGVDGGEREEEYEEEEEGEEEEKEEGEEAEEEADERDGFFESFLLLVSCFLFLVSCFLFCFPFCSFNTPKDDALLDNGSIMEGVDRLAFSSSSEEE